MVEIWPEGSQARDQFSPRLVLLLQEGEAPELSGRHPYVYV